MQDPVYVPIDVEARVWLRQGAAPSAVGSRIRQRLQEHFASFDFGFNMANAEVAWSDVLNVVRDTDGVRKVDRSMTLNGIAQDAALRVQDYPVLGKVALVDDAGRPLE